MKSSVISVTTALLGKANIPNLSFDNPDGTPLRIDTDYFGRNRDVGKPFPGPFENIESGPQTIKVWPKPRERSGPSSP